MLTILNVPFNVTDDLSNPKIKYADLISIYDDDFLMKVGVFLPDGGYKITQVTRIDFMLTRVKLIKY